MTRWRDAWCAGQPVRVPVKDGPVNPLRVDCPSCGQPRGRDCIDLSKGDRTLTVISHATRQAKAEQLHAAEVS